MTKELTTSEIIRNLIRVVAVWTDSYQGLQAYVDEINEKSAQYDMGLETAFQSAPSEVAPIFRSKYLAQIDDRTKMHRLSIENEKDLKKLIGDVGITIKPSEDDKISRKLEKLVKKFTRNQERSEREINGKFRLLGDPKGHSSRILRLLKYVCFQTFKDKIAKLMAYKDIIEGPTIPLPSFSNEVAGTAKKTVIVALQKSA